MRYDQGYGRHGGWEMRMPDGGRGWDGGYPAPQHGGEPVDRPWVGGYREGYQGGSGGYALRTTGPLYESYGASAEGAQNRERGYRRPRGSAGPGQQGRGYFVRARAGYGSDFGARDGGDRFAYEDAAGGTDFGAGNARPGFGELGHLGGGMNAGGGMSAGGGRYGADYGASRGGGYGRDFARGASGGYGRDFGPAAGGGYDRGMRGGAAGGGYDRGMMGGMVRGGYDRGMMGGGGYDRPFRPQGQPGWPRPF